VSFETNGAVYAIVAAWNEGAIVVEDEHVFAAGARLSGAGADTLGGMPLRHAGVFIPAFCLAHLLVARPARAEPLAPRAEVTVGPEAQLTFGRICRSDGDTGVCGTGDYAPGFRLRGLWRFTPRVSAGLTTGFFWFANQDSQVSSDGGRVDHPRTMWQSALVLVLGDATLGGPWISAEVGLVLASDGIVASQTPAVNETVWQAAPLAGAAGGYSWRLGSRFVLGVRGSYTVTFFNHSPPAFASDPMRHASDFGTLSWFGLGAIAGLLL
jgi:hypothetical protein